MKMAKAVIHIFNMVQ